MPLLLLKPVEIEKIKATEMCMKHYIHFLCTSNWSHDHHHCGRCKVLYLATNVCSTKKKKENVVCMRSSIFHVCLYCNKTVISFFFSLRWNVFIHQNKILCKRMSLLYRAWVWLDYSCITALAITQHTWHGNREASSKAHNGCHLQQGYNNHKASMVSSTVL